MGEMKYLHEYCDFDSAYAQAERENQEEYESGYYPDSSNFELAEIIALRNMGLILKFFLGKRFNHIFV